MNFIEEELKVVKQAPLTFVVVALLLATGVWSGVDWAYRAALNNKNAQIELQGRQIAQQPPAPLIIAPVPSTQRSVTEVTESPYRVKASDEVVEVLTLPAFIMLPGDFPPSLRGKVIVVKDKNGSAYQEPIIITAENGKIDEMQDARIVNNYGSIAFRWDGKKWGFD